MSTIDDPVRRVEDTTIPETLSGVSRRLSPDVAAAVERGQRCVARCTSTSEGYRYDLALDELLRQPDKTGEPAVLLDAALAHARTTIRRRARIARVSHPPELPQPLDALTATEAAVVREATDLVVRSTLPVSQRMMLLFAIADLDTVGIANRLSLQVWQVRQRLARARRAARAQFDLGAD